MKDYANRQALIRNISNEIAWREFKQNLPKGLAITAIVMWVYWGLQVLEQML